LSGGTENLNVRAALLHVMGDLLGSVAALVSGTVIWLTDWTPIDPLLSLLIVVLILVSAVRISREALHVLIDGVSPRLDLEQIGYAMAAVDGVFSVHDLHIWPCRRIAPHYPPTLWWMICANGQQCSHVFNVS